MLACVLILANAKARAQEFITVTVSGGNVNWTTATCNSLATVGSWRFPKRDPQVFKLLLDDFLMPQLYDVISASAKVTRRRRTMQWIIIRLRMLTDPVKIKSRLTAGAHSKPTAAMATNP